MSWPVFNSEQIEYMEELARIPPEEKCYCGWSRKGQCYNCNRRDDLKDLSAADKIRLQCPECKNAPGYPGQKLIHIRGCSRKAEENP